MIFTSTTADSPSREAYNSSATWHLSHCIEAGIFLTRPNRQPLVSFLSPTNQVHTLPCYSFRYVLIPNSHLNFGRSRSLFPPHQGFWSVVTKRPKVQGSEKWGVKCSKVQWSAVKWSDDLGWYVLSLIYSYVTIRRFFAARCDIIICIS
jgi:hypothetical protein